MSMRTITMTDELYEYLHRISLREPTLLARLREETSRLERANMQIAPEQGQFMALLAETLDARKALEIGTFTGYSALVVALAMHPDGRLIACDVSEEWTAIGRRYWEEAGVGDKIDLRLGPATSTLDELLAAGGAGTFDFVFIDADKTGYDDYYERSLRLLRPGGLMAIDNVLWNGNLYDLTITDADTVAIRALNEKLHADERVSISLVPIGEGLTLARKRN